MYHLVQSTSLLFPDYPPSLPSPPLSFATFSPFSDFSMSFPCSPDATRSGMVNFTVLFNTTMNVDGDDEEILLNKTLRFSGIRMCNCTTRCNMGEESTPGGGDDLFQNGVFYGVIGCVGVIIILVIVMGVLYHCVLVGNWRKNQANEEIE